MSAFSGIPITLDSSSLINATSQDFEVVFNPPLFLGDDKYELGLVRALLWYSFYNISPQYNNTTARYSPDGGTTWKSFTILSGQYTIDQLNSRIQSIMLANGDYTPSLSGNIFNISISADFSTLSVLITVSNNYQLDLTISDLNLLLGFNKIIVTTTQLGNTVANINNGINSLKISCDILTGSYDNNANSNTLYVFTPTSGPGTQINIQPPTLLFIPVRNSRAINSIRMRLLDNLNRTIDLNGEPITYLLYLRRVSKVI